MSSKSSLFWHDRLRSFVESKNKNESISRKPLYYGGMELDPASGRWRGCQSIAVFTAMKPKLAELKGKIRHLQQVKRTLEEDLRAAQCLRHALQEEQDALCTAAHQLETTYREKEESCKVLQYKCEELEFDLKREQQLSSETEDLVQQYTFQIQEMKLKDRKLRMKFEGELQQLMAQHKHLYSVYSPEQLPGEIERLQKVTVQLLKAEELRLSQLNSLEEEVKQAANWQQPVGGAADTAEAHIQQACVPHIV